MPTFMIGEISPERAALAADLIAAGQSVSFGNYELRLSSQGRLIVSILAWDPVAQSALQELKTSVAHYVDEDLSMDHSLKVLNEIPRVYELIDTWGNGSTWNGYWVGDDFRRGRLPE
jgi:hypothetical protein